MKAYLEIVNLNVNDIVTTSTTQGGGGANEGTGTCTFIPGVGNTN